MTFERQIKKVISESAKYFPVIAVIGSRQAGKTTIIRQMFPEFGYYNLENLSVLDLVKSDPLSILEENGKGLIIDEVQRFPEILSYIQAHVDETKKMGKIVISGSQNLLISEKVSQTLAGRVAYCHVSPMSLGELNLNGRLKKNIFDLMRYGGYPAIYDRKVPPEKYYEQYIATYIERDVRGLRNVGDLSSFRKLLILLAGRVGQLVNYSSLAGDIGVSSKTVEDWISVLEASYVIFRHQPYFVNIGKRLTKSSKIYFSDTGVLCYLLGVTESSTLKTHYLAGGVFENWVVLEVNKLLKNTGTVAQTYFYRDSNNVEVDLLVRRGEKVLPLEIKLGTTFAGDFFKGIETWKKVTGSSDKGLLVFTGKSVKGGVADLINWVDLEKMVEKFFE